MSTQHSLTKNNKKKIKLVKVKEDVSRVAEYKRCAILKYCNENGIENYQLDVSSISNELHNLGMCYCFLLSIICLFLEVPENFYMIVLDKTNVVVIITKHIHNFF